MQRITKPDKEWCIQERPVVFGVQISPNYFTEHFLMTEQGTILPQILTQQTTWLCVWAGVTPVGMCAFLLNCKQLYISKLIK